MKFNFSWCKWFIFSVLLLFRIFISKYSFRNNSIFWHVPYFWHFLPLSNRHDKIEIRLAKMRKRDQTAYYIVRFACHWLEKMMLKSNWIIQLYRSYFRLLNFRLSLSQTVILYDWIQVIKRLTILFSSLSKFHFDKCFAFFVHF